MISWKVDTGHGWFALYMYKAPESGGRSMAIWFTKIKKERGDYKMFYNRDMVASVPQDILPDKIKKQLDEIASKQEAP